MEKLVKIFLPAMLPIIELRGAIPLGVALGYPLWEVIIVAVLGSTFVVPIVFFIARPIINFLLKLDVFKNIVTNFIEKTLRKSHKIQKYEFWGMVLFVGIPLPGTGAWTGTLIAVLLDMRFKRTFWAIFLGNIMAGVIMLILSTYSIGIFKLLL